MEHPNTSSARPEFHTRTVTVKCLPLQLYVRRIEVIQRVTPVGSSSGDSKPELTDEVKVLLRRILALMPDPDNEKRRCLLNFGAQNIMVNLEDGRPFLDKVYWTRYSASLAKKNYAHLAQIFLEVVMEGIQLGDFPKDFTQLITAMTNMGHSACHFIKFNSSLVKNIDKKELFMRLHGQLHDVLRHNDLQDYHDILQALIFPQDWDKRADKNKYLKMIFNFKGSKYQPQGSNPAGEVVRYDRNSFTHGLERSVDPVTLEQNFDQVDLARMLEAELELLLWSLQLAMHKKGHLKKCQIESLFQ